MNHATEENLKIGEIPMTVFFDTNFLRPLLKGDFHDHMVDLNSDLRVALQLPFRPWRTPFSYMEWIGLNSESIPKPAPFDLFSTNGTNFIEAAYNHYSGHYNSVRKLDGENLAALTAAQQDHVCSQARDIWDNTMDGFLGDRDVSDWLRFALSFDAIHKLDVSEDYRSAYWSDLIAAGFFKADKRIRNLSKFRLAYRLWIRTRDQLTQSGVTAEQRSCIEDTHRLLSLGNWKDYLDADVIHTAAYGVETSDGIRHRVVCLTCDHPDVITQRIRLYKGFLSYVHKLYLEEATSEEFPHDFEKSHNGEVFCFDATGKLIQKIDVATDAPALPFLGKKR